jgi:hypothetical protein
MTRGNARLSGRRQNHEAHTQEATMPTKRAHSPVIKTFPKKASAADKSKSPSDLIDARIAELGDWRGELLSRLRALIKEVDSRISEEWKWNTPVSSCEGIICTGETYKKVVKLTFAKGASVADPSSLFNSSMDGNVRRAIDFQEGGTFDSEALKALVRAAVDLNRTGARGKPKNAG